MICRCWGDVLLGDALHLLRLSFSTSWKFCHPEMFPFTDSYALAYITHMESLKLQSPLN